MSTTKLRRLHIVGSIDRSIYGSAFSATTKIKDLKKTKKGKATDEDEDDDDDDAEDNDENGKWCIEMAILDCIQGLHFDGSEDTLPLSFHPFLFSCSSLHCSSLTLSPSPRSHYFGIVFVTASYDAIIDLSKKQNTLCQKKTKNWPEEAARFQRQNTDTHTQRDTHRRLFGSKKCGKFGNAH